MATPKQLDLAHFQRAGLKPTKQPKGGKNVTQSQSRSFNYGL